MGKVSSKVHMGRKSKYEINCGTSSMELGYTPGVMTLSHINNHLAIRLYHLLPELGSVLFSPFSISSAMAMLFCAVEGETEDEVRKVLGHEEAGMDKDEVMCIFEQHLSELMKSRDSYTFTFASSLLTQKDFKIKDIYKSILTEAFKTLPLEVDFQVNAGKIIGKINNWVSKKTHNEIPHLIDSLDPDTVMLLLNAAYFKGDWLQKFDEALTLPGTFYLNGKEENPKTVAMMHITEKFIFSEAESFQSLHLPYDGDDIAMLILLPRKIDGLEELEAKLTPPFFNDFFTRTIGEEVEVTLPRFRLEYTASFVPLFQEIGIVKLFNRDAELGGASDSQELFLSQIVHKAVLEVNEKGSEAPTGSKDMCVLLSAQFQPHSFVADHPFLFAVYEKKSQLILFMGRVTEL